jgi:hypothetical protein
MSISSPNPPVLAPGRAIEVYEAMVTATTSPEEESDAGRRPLRSRAGAGHAAALRELLDRNVFFLLIAGACCAVHAVFVRAGVISDAWLTILSGRAVAHTGLPHHDQFTLLTLGHRWVDQQWLAQLGFYGLWSGGGWRLVGVIVLMLYLMAFGLAAVTARRLGASDRSVALVFAACFLTGLPNTVFRAQILAYVLFSLVLGLLLSDARRPTRHVYLVFPLLALWANVHGSVVVGAGLVTLRGVTVALERLRARAPGASWIGRAGSLLVLPWLCTLVSPYGLALPGYYRSVLGNSTLTDTIAEWAPSTLRGQPLFFALLLGGLWVAVRSRTALTGFAKLTLVLVGVLGLLAVRNDVWFALAAAAILPIALDGAWAPSGGERRRALNVALGAAGVAIAAGAIASVAIHGRSWFERDYPPKAAAVVEAAARSDPRVRVFADERYADWLLFVDPALAGRVAFDIRFELLSKRQLTEIVDFRTEHGLDWQRAARGYGLLVLDPAGDTGAIRLFSRLSGTTVLFRDSQVVVLRRPAR